MLNDQQILADLHALPEDKQAEVLDFIAWLKSKKTVPVKAQTKKPILGAMPGLIVSMADDFDAPLDDFAEYMS